MVLLVTLPLVLFQLTSLTITIPSTPLPKALEILSQATGKKLLASPSLANEVVLTRLSQAPTNLVLKRLAESLNAEWQPNPDGSLLLREDFRAIRRLQKQDAEFDLAALRNSFSYVANQLAQQPQELDPKTVRNYKVRLAAEQTRRKAAEAAQDYARAFASSSLAEQAPGWRALAGILPIIGMGALLGMPNEAREVWAEGPTSVQHVLPSNTKPLLEKYRRELALLDPNTDVRRIEIRALKWETGTACTLELKGLDSSGKVVDTSNIRLNNDSDLLKIPITERGRIIPKPDEVPFNVSREANDARVALSNVSKDVNRGLILERWRPKLLDPVRFEPTQWHISADFVAAAEATGSNLIGTVNDLISSNYWEPERLTPSQFLGKHTADYYVSSDRWILVRSHERFHRTSRMEGREWIINCVRQGGVTVDEAARWAGKSDDLWPFSSWIGDYLRVLFPGRGPYSALSTMIDEHGLRLWNSLGSGVHESLRHGDRIRLSDLRPVTKSQINQLVFWFDGLDDNSIEPTDRFPNGLTDGSVFLTVSEKPVIEGWSSSIGPPTTHMPIDAAMFGRSLIHGSTYWEIPADIFKAWNRFRVGIHRTYDLHFVLQPGNVPMTESLGETLFDPSAQVLEKLPEAIRIETEKARQAELAKPTRKTGGGIIPPQ